MALLAPLDVARASLRTLSATYWIFTSRFQTQLRTQRIARSTLLSGAMRIAAQALGCPSGLFALHSGRAAPLITLIAHVLYGAA